MSTERIHPHLAVGGIIMLGDLLLTADSAFWKTLLKSGATGFFGWVLLCLLAYCLWWVGRRFLERR